MVSKNNRDLYLRRSANKVSKYTIKKLSVGVTSVLVGTAFFIGSTSQANASEQETTQQSDTAVKASDTSSTNDSSRLKVQEASQDQASTSTTSTTDADQAQATENATSTQASTSTTSTNDAQGSSADEINQTNTQVENNKQEVATATQAESNNDSVLSNNNVANSAESQAKANEETDATPQYTAGFRRANVDTSARALAANTDNTIADVSSWQELISAMGNSNYQTINVNGAITAFSNGNIGSAGHSVTVKGNNGSINFGNNTLVANGGAWNITFEGLNITTGNAKGVIDLSATSGNNTVTFKDVTQSGTSLYGGGGNTDVVIDGTTTSTVDNASAGKANTYNATSREANIHDAKSVTVANGANFTLNRSSIGDGINLPDGSTVKVGDDATFTVNMNTNNATDSARYHNAGIFMQNGGNFVTGRNSVVNMNTSVGQAISMGAKRPGDGVGDRDRFGGYGTGQSRNAGPSKVELGENSTFNFTGRDGIILGNNSSFISGEYSKVHFQNKGRGVALDLANDSNITISKHSDTLFESNGKTGTSGSYDGYNYIGVNEGGNILIDEFATFRVILTNRGDNPWDDVISLDSRGSNTSASFVSKKGAIVDIRDDNTNFYAELISFPLGAANSKIDIQDPLYVNLQRYSAGGAITGWMNVGGVDINTTNNKYTANLIYMGGNKGTLRIGGTDYVVYQQIKSDGTKQIWLDVNDVTFNKSGFNSKDHYNNGANPDISISGSDLVAGVKANNIKDDNSSPTSGKDAPYYGISTMRASHQIWFPHGTTNQAAGTHKNVIKYVYEDGTEAAPTVTQEVDMTRDMTLAITPDKIKDIQNYASTHTSDETLAYIRNNYAVTEDSGWQIAKGVNTKTAYDAVNTPKIDGYEAQIKSTNANGVTVGSAADTVKANLDIPDEIVKDGQLTDAYKNNGVTGIPQDYETVVVYKKAVQDQSVTIIYQDKSDNNKVLATDTVKGKPGTELGYTTTDKITDFENKGYKLVSDGVPKNGAFGNEPETYYVTLEHATTTVTPDPKDPDEVAPQKPGEPINPNDPEGPKWPDEAGEDAVKKPVKATVNYTGAPENPTPNVQNANLTKTVTIDKVTGKVISETPWTQDKDNYDPVKTPVVDGYYADTAEVPGQPVTENDITTTVTYKPLGKIVPKDKDGNEIPGADQPQYNNDPKDPTKGGETPVPTIPGYHLEDPSKTTVTPDPKDPGKDTPVIYVKDEADKYNLVENFVDEAGNKLADSVTKGTDYKEGNDYDVTGDAKVIKGYYLKEIPANAKGTFGKDNVTVNFVYAKVGQIVPVDPEGNEIPDAPTPDYTNDPDDPTKVTPNQPTPEVPGWHVVPNQPTPGVSPDGKTVTPPTPGDDTKVVYEKNEENKYSLVENFVDEAGNKLADSVTKGTDYKEGNDYDVAGDAKVIEGYYLKEVPANAKGTFGKDNVTVNFVYAKVGKIVPVDPDGNEIPDAPTPDYTNDPDDPTKVTPNQPTPEVPGWHVVPNQPTPGVSPDGKTVTPPTPGDDTKVVYEKNEENKCSLVENFVDEAGNKLADSVTKGTDYKEGADYDVTGDTQVIKGYYLKEVPANAKGTFGKDNVTVNFVYAKVGHIVPVDPEGNEIPDAPTPDYTNDPDDPTKVTPNQPVPEIPGYTPEVPTVTPDKPGEDTPVIYVKNQDQKAVVKYVDDTTGETLETKDLAGKAGATSDYRTADTIANYVNKGYELVSDNYPADGVVFDNDDKTTQSFEVHLKHGTTPVNPENPGKPGEPINPNDPEGPKWPAGTDKDSVQKNVKETVHYVGADDKTPADVVQDATWTRELTVDKVTGKIISEGDWKSDKDNYDEVKTPVVEGYVADKATVPSTEVTQDNIEVTVTYNKVGKIVPVDPEGNEIPDAPTPNYTNDPEDPTKVTPNQPVPEIPGYTPEVPTVTPDKPGEDTPVIYVKNQDQKAVVKYIDDTTGETLEAKDLAGKAGATSDYRTKDTIANYVNKGYELVSDNYPADGVVFDNDDKTTQSFEVHLKHGTTPVTPEKPGKPGEPINPNDPEGPKWPAGTDKDSVQKNVKETVHYVGADDKTPSDVVQDATWTRELTVDKVTGKIINEGDWKSDKDNYDEVKTPVVEGYVADKATVPSTEVTQDNIEVTVTYNKVGKIVPVDPEGNEIPDAPTPDYTNDPEDPTKVTPNQPVPEIPGYTPQVPSVTPDKPGEDTPVIYVKNQDQKAVVKYIDDTTGETLETKDLAGKAGATSDYRTADTIANYVNKGYELVSDNYPADGVVFDNDDKTTQSFEVHLKHGTTPVNPENPGKPGEPINPNDPEGPKWPAGTDKDSVQKNVKETVHYVGAGDKTPSDVVQDATWTRELTVDKVTGEIVSTGDWKSDKDNYDEVKTPVVEGYVADKATVPSTEVTQDNIEVTVTYNKVGKIVPVDPEGNEIPDAPTPDYKNDPEDPTKVVPNQPVPEIPGFVPEVPTVTPDKPGEDTPVKYVPVTPEVKDQTAKIIYRDETTGQDLSSDSLTGKPGSKIDYSTADKIKELTDKGYVLVNDGFPAGVTFDNDDKVDQTYYVTFKHGTTPVTPENPGKPGEPINPNDPEGPKWSAGTDKDSVQKNVKETVHYVGAGDKTPSDVVQDATWTRELTVDKVTGEIVSTGDWKSDKDNYDEVKTPVVEGYVADKATVPSTEVTQDNIEVTVTYNKVGKIVPVDPEGNEIPDAPTPDYTNDPDDPTKVVPNQPVPEIPGFVPEVPTVTPDKPGEDTPVKYVPVTPEATEQKAKVIYRDLTTDADLASDSLTGKAGSKIDYSTADKIKELLDKGYVLVTDGFPADATFDDNDDVDQVYYVSFKHGEVPVGPDNPHKPGEPINPNDPNGPKWPATDEYSKEFTSTVHFVDDKGNKLRDDDVQTSTWTRTLIVDTVTGEIKNPNASWTPDKGNYKDVKVPVITGYYADKANVPGAKTQQKDLEVTVTYREIGKIVPVDPNGNKIPDAPTPQYQNDPEDPTKVTITDTPKVPGYTTSIVSVTPGVPGEDTPVIYTKVETPQTPVEVPTTPAQPEVVTPAPAKEAPQAAAELPQMGDANETTMAAVGAAIVAATLGLVGFGVKKKDEENF